MATYKVIQDIEAEDKLVGPFSFRQFVYFLIGAFLGYLNFICVSKGAAFLLVLFGPPMAFCFFFAWPWSADQPTEVWALAHIRFYFKSRKRVWDQSGIKEFVTITVPKRIERVYTDGLSQAEVRSRLQALSQTIDSRGWAVKNAVGTALGTPNVVTSSDRLLNFNSMPQEVQSIDIRDTDDILDAVNNPVAQHMSQMVDAAAEARRQELVQYMQTSQPAAPAPAAPQWFTPSQTAGPQQAAPIIGQATPAPAADSFNFQLPAARPSSTKHLKVMDPTGQASNPPVDVPAAPQTPAPVAPSSLAAKNPLQPATAAATNPAILNLAHDNNLDVATIAREAQRTSDLEASGGEVEVSLR